MAVVVDQHHGFKPPLRSQRCRLQSSTHLDYFVLEHSHIDLVHSLGQAVGVTSFHRSVSTPCLTLNPKVEEDSSANPRIEIIGGKGVPIVRALVAEVAIAVAFGVDPVPVSSGLGGAYFLCTCNGDIIAVAKPVDEEPLAFNNPKGLTGKMLGQPGLRRSVRLGETGMRELAAYLLDHGAFAGVPPTALVKISNLPFHVNTSPSVSAPPYKIASLQRFVDHDCDAGELGASGFSVSSVHRIGILDIRLLNIDRHSGNILLRKIERDDCSIGEAELVPIDHGLCLPEWLDDPYFEWLHWPQASIPFSEFELEYISKLNPFEDAKLLRTELPSLSESSIRVLVICTIFLKQAAAAGLCLSDIGDMLTRECYGGEEAVSILENVCAKAKDSVSDMSNYNDYGSRTEKKSEEDIGVFQFDDNSEDNYLNPPHISQNPTSIAKPVIPKFNPARSLSGMPDVTLAPMLEEKYQNKNSYSNKHGDNIDNKGSCSPKMGCLTRSFSFAVSNHRNETGAIALGDMDEEEWELFLVAFEKLLPKVFEARKSIGLTQRLGTSCRL